MKKYKRAVIFAGGGNRFAVYGGIYAALVESKLVPDLIIGSCGASLSATIISHLKEPSKIKDYFKSKELYTLGKNLKLTDERKFFKLPLYLLMKFLFLKKKKYIQDVVNRFLIDFPSDIEEFLPNLVNEKSKIDTIIIASKLNFSLEDINKKINNEKLYKEILFTNIKENLNININRNRILRTNSYQNSIVDENIEIINDLSLVSASRISMADMFLLSPVFYKNNYYAGGAVDLLPFEIANFLADEIFLELKQSYNLIENSALKLVLAYDGNKRFQEVSSMSASQWIDTSDMPQYFKKNYNFLDFNFLKMELKLNSLNYEEYCNDIDSQWNYGYNRMIESIKLGNNFKEHQRIKIK